MKIGILQCDDVLEQFQPEFGTYPSMIMSLFSSIRENIEFDVYDVRENHYPVTIEDYDAYITTGSRHGINDDLPWIPLFLDFIRALNDKKHTLIGICFGHQAIVKALGGKVVTSEKGWGIGLSKNELVNLQHWMTPQRNPITIVVSHKDQVTELPSNAIVLYRSDFCPNYMLQVGKHIISIQGHPEFCSAYSKTLMLHRQKIIPDDILAKGLESLTQEADDKLLAQWMLQFIDSRI